MIPNDHPMNWEDSYPNDLVGYWIMVVLAGYIPMIPPPAMIKPANGIL